MTTKIVPTKGNLIATKKSLEFSLTGFDLLDKKRNILIKEMMSLIEDVKAIRGRIISTYQKAYDALQEANISLGIITDLVNNVPVDEGIVTITFRSVMGVEIPKVIYKASKLDCFYDLETSNSKVDVANHYFHEVKELTVALASVENAVYRLANAISKTQKRANALQNVSIPDLKETVKFISDVLEEKEREEFSRQKVIKKKS